MTEDSRNLALVSALALAASAVVIALVLAGCRSDVCVVCPTPWQATQPTIEVQSK